MIAKSWSYYVCQTSGHCRNQIQQRGDHTTSLAFSKIFAQLNLHAAEVEGDSFHRYARPEMGIRRSAKRATPGGMSATRPPNEAASACWNNTPIEYGRAGKGKSGKSVHTYDEAVPWDKSSGTFTPWQPLPEDPLIYCFMKVYTAASSRHSITLRAVDLLVGVVPMVSLRGFKN
ncbi:hypothetical protein ACLK1S_20795 [Escherichia coli]